MKIFLAGTDRPGFALVPYMIGYPYRLCSYLYLRDNDRAIHAIKETQRDGSEWIMDSGLFSFMFGAQKGALNTFEDYQGYAIDYLSWLNKHNWNQAIVECDVQRVLGVDECNRLRNEVFRKSGREVIYVWHVPEGEDGLRELAQREKRIALSVPELRQVFGTGPTGGMKVRGALIHLLSIIRKSGGTPRVHLLGNTEKGLVELPADSCDSTSWNSGGRYGWGYYFDPAARWIDQASLYSPKWKAWRSWCEQEFAESFALLHQAGYSEAAVSFQSSNMCSAIAYMMLMECVSGQRMRLHIPKTIDRSLLSGVSEADLIGVTE